MSAADEQLTPEEARRRLAEALNAIEDRMNVPKRASRAAGRFSAKAKRFAEEQPGTVGAGVAGAVTLVGLGIWAAVRR